MRAALLAVMGLALLAGSGRTAPGGPPAQIAWVFPPASPAGAVSTTRKVRLPGVAVAFIEADVHDQFKMVDWRPKTHPPAPPIVSRGHAPGVRACGYCHLPDGSGRPENAALNGLPADYIVRQLADFRSGARRSAGGDWGPAALMQGSAAALSPAEAKAAARYFASIPYRAHTRVVETAQPPRVTPSGGIYRFDANAHEPIGQRILEGPDDFHRFELRDTTLSYVAYVPPGSIAAGDRLAATGGGRTQVCVVCHGPGLKGAAGPPLAGRSPSGLLRELYAFKTGARNGAAGAPMRQVAAQLSLGDMIALSAYAGSLKP